MNVGLVMAGGMAKGAYQIGALKAISEYFAPGDVKYISAASVGALNTFAYAAGNLSAAARMWRDLYKRNDRIFLTAVLKSDYLKHTIDKVTAMTPLCRNLYAPVFRITSRSNCYVDLVGAPHDLAAQYMTAALAFFPFRKPVLINGSYYCDGAIIDDIPVYPLLKHGLDYVICVYFDEYNYTFESKYFDNKIVKISLYDPNEVLKQSLWFTKDDTERMFEVGYKKAKAVLDFVFAKGMDDADVIYSQIEMLNSFNPKKQIRLTGDVAVGKINSFVKTLTKRKIID